MRAVVQRVTEAAVTVEGRPVGAIGPGLVVLVGVTHGDSDEQARWLAQKVANLRVFEDQEGKMNRSVADIGGRLLVVSQFTLYADTRKGNRPGFSNAAPPGLADSVIGRFVDYLRDSGLSVETGVFGARMLLEIHNDGPVTIIVDTPA